MQGMVKDKSWRLGKSALRLNESSRCLLSTNTPLPRYQSFDLVGSMLTAKQLQAKFQIHIVVMNENKVFVLEAGKKIPDHVASTVAG